MIAAHAVLSPGFPREFRTPPGRGVARRFLGWDAPALHAGVEALLDDFGAEMGRVLVVLPGARAGRMLLAILAERAAERGLFLAPPEVTTPGGVAGCLLPRLRAAGDRTAGAIAKRLAWMDALREAAPETLSRLAPGLARAPSERGLAGAAALLEKSHDELVGHLMTFADVASDGAAWFAKQGVGSEAERWLAAARVQGAYAERLAELGLVDEGLERLRTLTEAAADPGGSLDARPVVLFGTADLPAMARAPVAMLADLHPELVRAYVFAPEERSQLFDGFGCVRASEGRGGEWDGGWGGGWDRERVPVPEEAVVFADAPGDQAEAALAAIARASAELGGARGLAASDFVLGVPDETLKGRLRRAAEAHGAEVRDASGRPLESTGPWLLLDLAADVLENGDFASVLAFVRHPDAELAVGAVGGTREGLPTAWLEAVDAYAAERLPGALADDAEPEDEADGGRRAAVAKEVARRVAALLGDLWARRGEQVPLAEAAEAGVAFLRSVYGGRTLRRPVPEERLLIEALCCLRDALRSAPQEGGHAARPAEVLRLVLASCAGTGIPEEPDAGAIEMTGWLEVPLDPAPVAVIVGMNEGVVPEGAPHDCFLPDGLRRALGLLDDRRRLARDCFLLAHLLHARRRVTLIAGRRGAEGDPLRPSRLLLRDEPAGVVRTVRRYVGDRPGPEHPRLRDPASAGAGGDGLGSGASRFAAMPILDGYEPPAAIGVTGFARYLRSPYRFYLTDILRLEEAGPPAEEMDALVFGTLIHAALDAFARTDAAASDRPDRVRQGLLDALGDEVRARFGEKLSANLWVQRQIAEQRLADLAPWQAAQAREGWRIVHSEWKPEKGGDGLPLAALNVDGAPIALSGKIDRIDRNEADGRVRIIDYKTGQEPKSPEQTHGRGEDGEPWKDLQLPLYRHLARSVVDAMRPPEDPQLAYLVLPASPVKGGDPLLVASWDSAALLRADERAFEVVRAVREGRFADPGQLRSGDTFAAIAGVGLMPSGEDDV